MNNNSDIILKILNDEKLIDEVVNIIEESTYIDYDGHDDNGDDYSFERTDKHLSTLLIIELLKKKFIDAELIDNNLNDKLNNEQY